MLPYKLFLIYQWQIDITIASWNQAQPRNGISVSPDNALAVSLNGAVGRSTDAPAVLFSAGSRFKSRPRGSAALNVVMWFPLFQENPRVRGIGHDNFHALANYLFLKLPFSVFCMGWWKGRWIKQAVFLSYRATPANWQFKHRYTEILPVVCHEIGLWCRRWETWQSSRVPYFDYRNMNFGKSKLKL
jgi:hypothetical protein